MREAHLLHRAGNHDDGHLVADHDDFAAISGSPRLVDGFEHPCFNAEERFAPTGLERVDQLWPSTRIAEYVRKPKTAAFEPVGRLYDALFGDDWQRIALGPRLSRLLGALQRARIERGERAIDKACGREIGHSMTELTEVIAR